VSGTFIGALNTSIVNVSIPNLMKVFHAELHQVEWIVTAFMIAYSVTMPLTNWLKERLSYRLLFVVSLAIFSFGSLLCGISVQLEMLIAARVIQALGGGMLGPLSMAIIADTFHTGERGRAIGIWGLGVVLGPAFGPVLGGYLSETFSWRWIFYINIPLGLIAAFLGWRYLHRKSLEVTHRIPFDLFGFIWITTFTISQLYALSKMAEHGLSVFSFGFLLLALASMYLFILNEKKIKYPLWDLSLFKNRVFLTCILITTVRSIALFGGIILLPLVLQGQMHLSESQSGLVMMPGSLVLALMMPLTGSLSDKGFSYWLTVSGLLVLSASFFCFAFVDGNTSQWGATLILLVRGIGIGLLVTPITALTMSSVKHSQAAMASSISNVAQQLGGSLGIALLVLIKSFFFGLVMRGAQNSPEPELFSLQSSFIVAGALVLLPLFLAGNLNTKKHSL
jgi:EmrB/QacA subfamily drug resistance transporter